MKIVVDSNIVFSASLSSNSKFRRILSHKEYIFYAPTLLYKEIFSKIDKILRYSKADKAVTIEYIYHLLSLINYIPTELISKETYNLAYDLCKDHDESDTPFVALALHLNAKLWTGDKIKKHIQDLGFDIFFEEN